MQIVVRPHHIPLVLVQVLLVCLQGLIDTCLYKLFQAAVRVSFHGDVSFLADHETLFGKLLLVSLQFLLEERHFAFGVLVAHLFHGGQVFDLLLLQLVGVVLLLGLDDHRELRLFRANLLDEFL